MIWFLFGECCIDEEGKFVLKSDLFDVVLLWWWILFFEVNND